ncbi:MAG: YjjG family noncanonical pyrimidine nucleotidase [Bacteroidota bacterium]
MKYEWLLFDLDNTLLDFDQAALRAFQQTLAIFNIRSQPHYYKLYKKINNKVWRDYENKAISSVALRPKRFELFLAETAQKADPNIMSATYLKLLVKHSTLLEDAKELLDFLQPNYKMAIITNGLKEVQRPRLALTKIDHYFEAIIVSDEIGVAKPQKAYFDHTFQQIQHPDKSSVLVIGDGLNSDIKGGYNFGLDTCWLNPKGQQNTLDLQPTYEIQKLAALKAQGIV